MKEDYCSFEVSKLLKEKGFDESCNSFYILLDNGDYRSTMSDFPYKNSCKYNVSSFARPTHQMAMKWLREKDIDIIIMPLFKFKEGRIYCYEIHSDNTDVREGRFNTYEEAVEAALKYTLENLI